MQYFALFHVTPNIRPKAISRTAIALFVNFLLLLTLSPRKIPIYLAVSPTISYHRNAYRNTSIAIAAGTEFVLRIPAFSAVLLLHLRICLSDPVENQLKALARGGLDRFTGIRLAAESFDKTDTAEIAAVGFIAETGVAVCAKNGKETGECFLCVALPLIFFRDPDAEVGRIAPETVRLDAADEAIVIVNEKPHTAEPDLLAFIAAMEILCGIADVRKWLRELIARDFFCECLLVSLQKTRLQRQKLQAFTAKFYGLQRLFSVQCLFPPGYRMPAFRAYP